MRILQAEYKLQTLMQHEEEIIDSLESFVPSKEINVLFNENGRLYYPVFGILLYAYRQGVVDDVEEGLYYDTMDDYNVSYRGNQKLSVGGTGVGEPSYYGSSSFVDGADEAVEYAYNANGAMTMDLNKGITNIAYDLLGNLKEITFDNNRIIRYIYAADGTRLRMVHLQKKNGVWLKDSVDYSGP